VSDAPENSKKKRALGPGGWLAILALGAAVGGACWYAVHAWYMVPDQMSTNGYVAMALGIVFSIVVGAGLMALVFWSHKKGYDR
jgi:hypothetical protein